MANPLVLKSWPPYVVGAAIGVLSWFAFATADHPLGVSSSFEDTAAVVQKTVVPQVEQTNPYFAARAEEDKPPRIGWEAMLVLGVFVGATISSRLSGDYAPGTVPDLWRWRFGDNPAARLIVAFLAGAVMMIGARLAQGCTSGHGISGCLQLAASSWLFTATFFAVGIATAFALYGKEGARHV